MIEMNLLPDIKKQALKAQNIKRLAILFSTLVSFISVSIFVIMLFYVDVIQINNLKSLSSDINHYSANLKNNTNLNKILTIQNQLVTVPQLQAQTPAASRLFGFLTQLTPTSASITKLNVDFNQDTMSITGNADSLITVNKFVDTIKFTDYNTGGSNKKAFSTVVLSSFGYSSSSPNNQPANFKISFNFDPNIFNNTNKVNLVVPSLTTTRSIIGQPNNLFIKNNNSKN